MDIFQYIDPYHVMQTYYQERKKHESDFSYSVWAGELGLQSSSTLRMMVNGKKKISMNLAEKFVSKSFATPDEKKYFRLLVMYAHAPTSEEKNLAWKALSVLLVSQTEPKESLDYFTYISDLALPKIQTMLSFDDQTWSEETLQKALKVDKAHLKQALEKLEAIGLAEKIESAEAEPSWRATENLLKVGDKLGDVGLRAYHNACLEEAKVAQSLPVETRRFRSLLLPLNEKEFKDLNDQVNAFAQQLIANFHADQYEGRRLFKLNLNYFPVSERFLEDSEVASTAEQEYSDEKP